MRALILAILLGLTCTANAQVSEGAGGYESNEMSNDVEKVTAVLNHLKTIYSDSKLSKLITSGPNHYYVEILSMKNSMLTCTAHNFKVTAQATELEVADDVASIKCGLLK